MTPFTQPRFPHHAAHSSIHAPAETDQAQATQQIVKKDTHKLVVPAALEHDSEACGRPPGHAREFDFLPNRRRQPPRTPFHPSRTNHTRFITVSPLLPIGKKGHASRELITIIQKCTDPIKDQVQYFDINHICFDQNCL